MLTDQVALGIGGLSLYLWLRGSLVGLALCTLAGCFTWPLQTLIGGILLLFPPPGRVRGLFAEAEEPTPGWKPPRFGAGVGAGVAAAAVLALAAMQLEGRVSMEGTEQLPVFPLSAAISGLFVFAVVAHFVPATAGRLWGIVRAIQPKRLAVAVAVVAAARIAGALLARRSGFSGGEILEEELWWSTLDPGIFIVILVSYFGPLMLALVADIPSVSRDSWRLGPGMAAVVAIGLLGALTTHPRELTDVVPFLLLPGVLAVRRLLGLGDLVLVAFFWISLAFSRIWLYIGPLETDLEALQHFPAQSFFMAQGPWTPPSTYAMQLAAVALTALLAAAALVRRRRSRPAARPR